MCTDFNPDAPYFDVEDDFMENESPKSPNKWCRFCGGIYWIGSRRWPGYCGDDCAKRDAADYERTEASR